ncbi:hypothetical protein Hmuk_1147 [Halomicrobium mukohataei DSM 12286]|uniref:Uncharacterized protein n=2 Tax=Halomicrobium mukohataei TaxID=57705 RepID=C7P244_HALMD|nr:hypothetical protein Hmuk_1147 [Halomicrobium mukohataei DSM 12286]
MAQSNPTTMFDQHLGDERPSQYHVLWDGGRSRSDPRIDVRLLEGWARKWGYDVDRRRRVDSDRADEPREQCRIAFAFGEIVEETLSYGDREYTFTTDRTPATYFELDECGDARLATWASERTLTLRELRIDGRDLVFDAVFEPGPGRVHGQWLSTTVDQTRYWLTG